MNPDALTHAGNAIFVIPSILAVVVGVYYWSKHTFALWGVIALWGCLLALSGISIRIGQWLLAGWTRVPPDKYGDWIFGVRDEITFVAALIFSSGCTLFMAGCARRGATWAWIVVWLALVSASATIGYQLTPR